MAALSSCRFKEGGHAARRPRGKIGTYRGETSSTRANFSTNLANLFHGRIRHADPWELSGSFQIRIDRLSDRPMFRVHPMFLGAPVTVFDEQAETREAIVRSLRRPNLLTSFPLSQLKLRGNSTGRPRFINSRIKDSG